ncbi:MAG: ABC transporter permease, partial [Clostridiales bacterium]|nr:ABC transporter permease [Clostridiales bacterium]
LFQDLGLVALASSVLGMGLGTPLAAGIWQFFRLIVGTEEMIFAPNISGYTWPLGFAAFTAALLLVMGILFVRRSNIMDILYEQRKSEPVKDVKRWYGTAGVAMAVAGAAGALITPYIMVSMGYTPQFWTNLFYLPAAVGIYMVLLFVVVRGFGGKKSYYRNIITRSMMKFQGRQTVLNMCVVTALVMAAYFAMFYTPMTIAASNASIGRRHTDFAFHYRAEEAAMPDQAAIKAMGLESGQRVLGYLEVDMANLATDGIDREWTDDGRFGDSYIPFYEEESFLSESAYNLITASEVDVKPGGYIFVTAEEYTHSPYDYIEDMRQFTNPTTMEVLPVSFQEEARNNLLHRYILLDDGDYAGITRGLDESWLEKWVQFDVDDPENSYAFASQLKNAIIDASSEESALNSYYDRVTKIKAEENGEAYYGDYIPEMRIDYAQRQSAAFIDWRYYPMFRVLDDRDFVFNIAVYLMSFIFISIICFAAVIVISYTRCLTIAVQNRQVYGDLTRLGAKRNYLYRSVKGQALRVFAVPALIGTVGISAFYALLMYMNSDSFTSGEIRAFGVIALLIALCSGIIWIVYRVTLGKVTRMLGVGAN